MTIHVDDSLMCGTPKFKKLVIDGLRRDFQVGSEDINDAMFVGQRVRWMDWYNAREGGAHIRVDQEKKVEELESVVYDKSLGDEVECDKQLHTQYRSVLGQINWLQSRTQAQSCYLFSRCASAAAGPKIKDCKNLNKLVRAIRAGVAGEIVDLRFWPLKGNLRIIGYPDAAYQNNEDKSSPVSYTHLTLPTIYSV